MIDTQSNIFNPAQKIYANLDRVIQHLDTGFAPPVLVEVDPSNACNQACDFCLSSYIHFDKAKGSETFSRAFLSKDWLNSLCDDFISLGVRSVNWTGGGEPTLNKQLGPAIERLGSSQIAMGMFTNGTLMIKHNLIDTVVKWLDWVRISVDCGRPETYDRIRGIRDRSHWDLMIDNVNALISQKNRSESPIDIGIGFVITPSNYTEICDFARVFATLDVTYCQFKPEVIIREIGGIQRSEDFWKEKVIPELHEARAILQDRFHCNEYKLNDLIFDPINLGRDYKKCLGSQLQPCVGADGHVYVCTNHRGWKQYSYGWLGERTFAEIWADLGKRSQIMDKIESTERFANCTQLCKPHESNKAMWNVLQRRNEFQGDEITNIMRESQSIVRHYKFI